MKLVTSNPMLGINVGKYISNTGFKNPLLIYEAGYIESNVGYCTFQA